MPDGPAIVALVGAAESAQLKVIYELRGIMYYSYPRSRDKLYLFSVANTDCIGEIVAHIPFTN